MTKMPEKPEIGHKSGSRARAALPVELPGNPVVLYLATIAFFFCFAIWTLYAPLGPYLMKWYGLSAGQVLILVAVPALLGSVLRIPIGVLADKYGGRVVFTLLLFFVTLPLVGAMFADSYVMFLVCGLFFGVAGASFIVGVVHVSVWYPQAKQGTALGVYGVGNVGTIMATMFVPVLINNVFGDPAAGPSRVTLGSIEGWHLIFGIYAVPVLILGAVYWMTASKPPGRQNPGSFRELFGVYKLSRLAWIFSYFYWVTFGGFVSFSLFLPTYFYDRWEIDRAQASLVYTTVFVLVAALTRPFGGWISDKINPRRVLIVTFGVSLVLLAVMTTETSFTTQLVCVYLFGFCCGIGNGCVFKLIPSYFTAVGAVGGLAGAVGGVGGFLMPIVMGMVKDTTGSYEYGFGVWAVICLGALVIALTPGLFGREKL